MGHHGPVPGPQLRPETDYDGEAFADGLDGGSAGGSRFLECTFRGCDLSELKASRARFSETNLYAVHGAGLDLAESTWADCVVQGARLGAVALYGSELARVRFEGCKIEFANFRGATLVDVEFVDCQLVEADFAEAKLTRVSFEGCRLVSPDFGRGTFKDVDLTGADLAGPRGVAGLRGATVSALQLIDLAPALAHELGLKVAD
ncbi:Pentapeptide repeat-containing protein [Pedococcus dokdonensis]|uniref:Pentapeptide repeat-containing protein n=1 Tax=Pedococcus dokdonensis TaxID=443156 RepID=A0A1H0SKR2_9MICO|nr:Pentapeptide repeat-containing protein [Pedococcus dokdonensis]